jgi:hypothetical protein
MSKPTTRKLISSYISSRKLKKNRTTLSITNNVKDSFYLEYLSVISEIDYEFMTKTATSVVQTEINELRKKQKVVEKAAKSGSEDDNDLAGDM